MRFVIIEPAKTDTKVVEAKNLRDLYTPLGLDKVDHGLIAPPRETPSGVGIMIVVDEFGLFKPKHQQRYFAIGRQLFGGNAVLYGFNEIGESVDLVEMPVVLFMSLTGVEDAIARGQIDRPSSAVNGDQYWAWPEPSPFSLAN